MIHFKLNNNKQVNLIQFNLKNLQVKINLKNLQVKINPLKNNKFNQKNKLKIHSKICLLRILNKVWNLLPLVLKYPKEMLRFNKINQIKIFK